MPLILFLLAIPGAILALLGILAILFVGEAVCKMSQCTPVKEQRE